MSIFDLFTERKSNSSDNRHHSKFNRNAVRSRNLRLESLEERTLLSAVPLSASEYADLRAQYAEFNLPENMSEMNVITLDLSQGDNLTSLKNAITTAGQTSQSDLIVVRTSDTANTLTYLASSSEITIDIAANQYGSISIVGLGPTHLTLDANNFSRIMTVSGNSTIAYLGGLTIRDGSTPYGGSGIYKSSGTLTITNCIISRNTTRGTTSSSGGGIYNKSGNLTITNCILSENSVTELGGGIYTYSGTLTITNSTLSRNTASGSSGSVNYGGGIYTYSGTLTVNNSIIASNTARVSGNDIYNTSNTTPVPVIGSNNISSFKSWSSSSNNIVYNSSKPLFVNSENGDYHLIKDSQAIDKGNNTLAVDTNGQLLAYDLDNNPRIKNGTVDIGAYEYHLDSISAPTLSVEATGSDSVQITVGEVENASGYTLEYSTSDDFTDLTSQNISAGTSTINGLNPNTEYYFRVKAVGAGYYLDSEYSETASVFLVDYEAIRGTYSEFNLPESQENINVIVVDLTVGDDLADLKNAITTAGQTTQSDLIVVHTSDEANTLTYTDSSDMVSINIDSTVMGSIAIVGLGETNLVLDANKLNRVMYIDGANTQICIGGMTIRNGKVLDKGGGIFVSNSTLTVVNCTISDNTALRTDSRGGGIYNQYGTLTVANSTIAGNSALRGGGIHNNEGTLVLTNSMVAGNTAKGTLSYGGGIYNESGILTVTNCTIAGNTTSYGRGGIYNLGTFTATNCIISRNYGGNVGGNLSSFSSNNLIGGYFPLFVCDPQFDSQGKLINADTMDLHLRSDSVAIDKGNNTAVTDIELDIDGNNRIYGDTVDIGAYEYQGDRNDEPIPYSSVVTTLNDTFDLYDDEWSLREAIYYAPEYVTITFADELEGTIVLTHGQLEIEAPLVIDGDNRITIDADQKSRVFSVSGGTEDTPVVLDGLTIQNGKSSGHGGGIFNYSGTLTVTNSTIAGNSTSDSSSSGGGISNQGMLTVTNSTISGNSTNQHGGGIDNNGTLMVTNSMIKGNTAIRGSGGGIINGGTLTATNSTISGNSAKIDGGGIANTSSNAFVTVTSCTIAGNTAFEYGSGICNFGYLKVTSSIISRNYSSNIEYNPPYSSSNNLIGGYYPLFISNPQFDSQGKLINADTMDLHLRSDSVAIDKGNNTAVTDIELDIDGNNRIYGDTVDIGAYEYQGDRNDEPIPYSSVVTTLNDTFDLYDDEWSLREAIYYAPEYVTITFADELEGTIVLTHGQLEIEAPLVIDGDNRITIDADQKSRVFSVSGGTEDTPVVLDGLTIQNGKTLGNGGGIYVSYGALTVTNCKITGNNISNNLSFYRGGGIFNESGILTVINSTIVGNNAVYGGGIDNNKGTLIVTNSTIAGNTVSQNGGGIYNANNGVITTNNTIIADNTKDTSENDIFAYNGIVSGFNSLTSFTDWSSGSGNLEYDPTKTLFVDAENGDYHLIAGSQAINKGNNSLSVDANGEALVYDLDGNARIFNDTVDIGAYEYHQVSTPTLSIEVTGSDSIQVTVGEVENASGYTLEYSANSDFIDSTTQSVSAGETSITGLNPNTNYYFRVKAIGEGYCGDSEYSTTVSATTDKIQLTAPTLTAVTTDSNSINVTVGEVENASDYLLEYSTSSDFSNPTSQNVSAGTFSINGLNTNTTYYFRVKAIGTGYYSNSEYSEVVSTKTNTIQLTTPILAPAVIRNTTACFSWEAVTNASGYQFEYKAVGSDNWTTETVEGTTASFRGTMGVEYTARVKALGVGNYSDSNYSAEQNVKIEIEIEINGKKVNVTWSDANPAADAIRYRVAGTAKWKIQKLRNGVTMYAFNAAVGTNYEIEVLLDQHEDSILKTTAVVLDQAKLKADKNAINDDTFQVSVTNYMAKNLANNVTQAIVTVNGVQTTLNIENQQGESVLTNGGTVTFNNGLFTFTEMASNTSYKVQISFADDISTSVVSSNLSVKTLKAPYLAPVINSATAVSDTSIEVRWETTCGKNTDTPAQKYTVQYSLDGNKWTNATTGATGNTYTIQKLKGGNLYQVRVLATKDSAFEASEVSDVLEAETLALPKAVLDKTSVTDDTFQINVTNYATTNLATTEALNIVTDKFGTVAIALQDGSGSAMFENGMAAEFMNGVLTFTNAPSNTQMKVQVSFTKAACTTSRSSALTIKTTKAAYNKPVLTNVLVVSTTSIQLEWETVYGKNSDTAALKYTVQYSSDGVKWTNATTSATGTSFTIQKLKPNTKYLVAVIANKDQWFNASEPSDSLLVTTLG